jgi:hypothetical protein
MTLTKVTTAATVALFALAATAATAAEVDVRCEKRANRSRASVDGNNLRPGSYRAVLKSGDRTARSQFERSIGDEAQFDFDSNQGDVAEGATPIGPNFIVNGRVRGYLVNVDNVRVTPIVTAICRVRN